MKSPIVSKQASSHSKHLQEKDKLTRILLAAMSEVAQILAMLHHQKVHMHVRTYGWIRMYSRPSNLQSDYTLNMRYYVHSKIIVFPYVLYYGCPMTTEDNTYNYTKIKTFKCHIS